MSFQRRLRAAARAFLDPSAPAGGEAPPSFAPAPEPAPPRPPDPQPGARHFVLVVLDSCRWDTFMAAEPRRILRLGEPQRRWSYASWTAPSHYNLLTGLLPHRSPQRVFASEVYKRDFLEYADRLAVPLSFKELLPGLWLPHTLKWELGYRTAAAVSLPVLNPATGINRDFDDYRLMASHADFDGMLDGLRFYVDRPCFFVLNVGETHYPYNYPGGPDPSDLPHISGVHGVAKKLASMREEGQGLVSQRQAPEWFEEAQLAELKDRQVAAVRYVDGLFEKLYDLVPDGTWVTVTSDHGELFGEGGYFGHGPIQHDKVYEVPFVEGLLR